MNPLTIKYTLEGSFVHGGVISDYVRGKQQTAYVEVYLNTSYIQRIKCFVKYGKYLRVVNASPQSTLFDIVTKAFSVFLLIRIESIGFLYYLRRSACTRLYHQSRWRESGWNEECYGHYSFWKFD